MCETRARKISAMWCKGNIFKLRIEWRKGKNSMENRSYLRIGER